MIDEFLTVHVVQHARAQDFVLVTNNAADFRKLYAAQPLHPGLVIMILTVDGELQQRLFTGVLEQLALHGERSNQVLGPLGAKLQCEAI